MSKQKVIIAGSSGHSKVVIDVFEKEGRYEIVGLVDSFREMGEETLGYKILGSEKELPELLKKYQECEVFIAIGDNMVRKTVRDKIVEIAPDVNFAKAVHPSAQIGKDVVIGNGSVVMAGAIINSATEIGEFSIINTKVSIDHDCRIGGFSSLAPGVTTGGSVAIGTFSAVSIGAIIKHGVSVGAHTVIGAGALVLKDFQGHLVVYGSPAKEIRKREEGEKYL